MKRYLYCICLLACPLFCADKEPVKNITEEKTRQTDSFSEEFSTQEATRLIASEKTVAMQAFETQDLQPQATKQANVLAPTESVSFTPILEKPYKSPLIATGLSFIVPGLGQMYLEKPIEACIYGSVFYTSMLYGIHDILTNPNTSLEARPYRQDVLVIGTNSKSYALYAAYRDARICNSGTSYSYDMPKDTFSSLAYAPFSFRIMTKPEVWGGILGALGLATLIRQIPSYTLQISPRMDTSSKFMLSPFTAFAVGLGEEAFFRGLIQSTLIENTNPTLGISLASMIFGLAHTPNSFLLEKNSRKNYYLIGIPFISSIGGYLGYLTYKNNCLQEAVAIHSWYDFILFAKNYFSQESSEEVAACVQKPRHWSFSWSF